MGHLTTIKESFLSREEGGQLSRSLDRKKRGGQKRDSLVLLKKNLSRESQLR